MVMGPTQVADAGAPAAASVSAEASTLPSPVWRRFAIIFLGVFFGGLGSIYGFLLLIDPYDTARFPTPLKPGVFDGGQRTANASRGRDPQFNAAVFGNSRGQLLDPQKLSAATGLSFVQLTTPGSGPKEHITLMRYFLRHHPGVEAIVLSVDERWCGHDPSLPVIFPFPFWLYRGDIEYLAHLLSTRAITSARNRIKLARGLVTPTDPRGYIDYESGRARNFHPAAAADTGAPVPAKPVDTSFPALAGLDDVLAGLPSQTGFVIVMPPVYRAMLPRPGTQIAADLPACKAALADRLVGRPRSGFLDYLVDGPIGRDPDNFMDREHYRMNIARLIEARIVAVLGAGDRAAISH
jgi:hypothetical protein